MFLKCFQPFICQNDLFPEVQTLWEYLEN